MLKYRATNLARSGVLGVAVMVLLIAVGLNPDSIISWATSVKYQAIFTEAGGIAIGNDVTKSGMKVGAVTDLSLERGKAVVTFTVAGTTHLGAGSTAHIRTGSLLGERILTLVSAGSDTLRPNSVIPATRTSSPYSLTEAVEELTTNTAGTDTDNLNQSLDTLSETIDRVAPQLGPTFDGLSGVARALHSRDDTLAQLLDSSADVSAILATRSQQINTLLLDAGALIDVLNQRRQALVDLLGSTSLLATQLAGVIADNEAALAPTLDRLNAITAMLEDNRDNIAKALPGLAKFQITQGETVSSGFYYNAYVPNLVPGQMIQPFLDYAIGLRRGVNAGQPPDNIGPRAEFPIPTNGIPAGPR